MSRNENLMAERAPLFKPNLAKSLGSLGVNGESVQPLSMARPEQPRHEPISPERIDSFIENEILTKHELYPESNPIYQFMSEKISSLAEAAGIGDSKLIIIQKEVPNMFVMPGYIVVYDELLRLLDYREEVEGVISHELGHLQRGHLDKTGLRKALMLVGERRSQETEADIAALEIMDKCHINPQGMVSALQKLHAYEPDKKVSLNFTHGNPDERAYNLEDLSWIADVRNLSYADLTPLNLAEEDFLPQVDVHAVVTAGEEYELLAPAQKIQFLRRKYYQVYRGNDQREEKVATTINWLDEQAGQLLTAIESDLDSKEIKNILKAIHFFHGNYYEDIDKPIKSGKVLEQWDYAHHSALQEAGFVPTFSQEVAYLGSLVNRYFLRLIEKQETEFPTDQLTEIIEKTTADTQNERMAEIIEKEIAVEAGRWMGLVTSANQEGAAQFFANTSIATNELVVCLNNKVFERMLDLRTDIVLQKESDNEFLTYFALYLQEKEDRVEIKTRCLDRLQSILEDKSLLEFLALYKDGNDAEDFTETVLYNLALKTYEEFAPSTDENKWERSLAGYLHRRPAVDSVEEEKASYVCQKFSELYNQLVINGVAELTLEDFMYELRVQLADKIVNEEIECYLADSTYGQPLDLLMDEALWDSQAHRNVPTNNWRQLAEYYLQTIESEPSNDDLLNFVALGLLSNDMQVRLQVPGAAMEQLVRRLSFDEAVDLIFTRYQHLPTDIFSASINYLIEEGAHSADQLATIEAALQNHTKQYAMLHAGEIGQASFAETTVFSVLGMAHYETDRIHGIESGNYLRALMATGTNDKLLQGYLYNHWRQYSHIRHELTKKLDLATAMRLKDRPDSLDKWASYGQSMGSASFEVLLNNHYLMNDFARHYILRKLLVGENGVLTTNDDKARFGETFEKHLVQAEDSEFAANLHTFIRTMFQEIDGGRLYQYILPTLKETILRYPEHPTLIEITAARAAWPIKEGLQRQYNQRFDTLFVPITKRLARIMSATTEEGVTEMDTGQQLLELFADNKKSRKAEKMTALDLLMLSGEKSGALGIRMLQLAGQYFDVSEEYAERLNKVYDSNTGQSRLQAYRVLSREAGSSPAIAGLMENITRFGSRIGGGSLMTVYDIERADGVREALAIKNPNVEYHLAKMVEALKTTLAAIPQDDSASTAQPFPLVASLLDDVSEWISNELHDPDFPRKDHVFRRQNDNRFNGVEPSNGYKLLVPDSFPTDTPWVRRDTFIEGKNLTALSISDDPTQIPEGKISRSDYRSAVSTITKNFFQQIQQGLVHSDIHPGNFRITSDNQQIAIFDRYNLLELEPADQQVIGAIVGNVLTGQTDEAIRGVTDYILHFDQNQGRLTKEQLVEQLTGQVDNGNLVGSMSNIVVSLKQSGVYVPLKLTLILKNFLAINRMSKQAGFTTILDALI